MVWWIPRWGAMHVLSWIRLSQANALIFRDLVDSQSSAVVSFVRFANARLIHFFKILSDSTIG
jgi:hypothetical protein